MRQSILDTLTRYDAETATFDAAINQAFQSGECIGGVIHAFLNMDSANEPQSSIQHGDDRACAGETGHESKASRRIQASWFGAGSGI